MPPRSAPPHLRRLAVLASGQGSNLQALIDALAAGRINAELVGVFSDKPDSGAIAIARDAGIPAWSQRSADFDGREAFDLALFDAIDRIQPELILCAGYMRIIGARHVVFWKGRMINLHPSLLPAYPGLHTHARALADGVKQHGASVHFVTPELDGGPVIAQALIDVQPLDTAESLAQRLRPREHALLCAVAAGLCDGSIGWSNDGILHEGRLLKTPLRLQGNELLRQQEAL